MSYDNLQDLYQGDQVVFLNTVIGMSIFTLFFSIATFCAKGRMYDKLKLKDWYLFLIYFILYIYREQIYHEQHKQTKKRQQILWIIHNDRMCQ